MEEGAFLIKEMRPIVEGRSNIIAKEKSTPLFNKIKKRFIYQFYL
jgi:hypothetical protein